MKRTRGTFTWAVSLMAVFLTVLIVWWAWSIHSHQTELVRYQTIVGEMTLEQAAHKRDRTTLMIVGEGLTLVGLLGVGLGTLLYLHRRDQKRTRDFQSLFALWTHECKTPLASIQLQAETLLLDDSNPRQKKYLERIVSDCRRLYSFMERVLEMARTERAPKLEVESGNLREDLSEWWDTEGSSKFNPALHLSIEGNGDYWALRERQALFHILDNIADNTLKHGTNNQLRLLLAQDEHRTRLSLLAPGATFKETDLPRLGELFYRGRPAMKQGTGLGLYLVRRLMEKMGGQAKFFNHADQSATVELIFARTDSRSHA